MVKVNKVKVEMVNHYVLGCLKRAKGENFDFRIIE